MNKLDFCISLRRKGFDSIEIKNRMIEQGFEDSEIPYYLKKSDEEFLDQLIKSKSSKTKKNTKNPLKFIGLALSLLLLISVLLGYVRMGLLGLFIIWGIIGLSSTRRS